LSQKVVTIEYFKKLANTAKKRLEKLKYMNVLVVNGDGRKGFEQEAPFDKVIITAGSEEVPKSLIFQLKAGGILVAPIGPQGSQRLLKFVKKNGGVKLAEDLGECQFVPLLGKPIFGTLDMGK
ncbi:MAG TPA: protein-L-isoaspartate O-methyltransferase, partial [Patescibacteria group bacterium]